jgi:hypothetical protein
MINRRLLLLGAAASSLGASPIVAHFNLMPVRSRIYVRRPHQIGLIDCRFIFSIEPKIRALKKGGLSAYGIADELARDVADSPFELVRTWSAQFVVAITKEAALLRSRDFAAFNSELPSRICHNAPYQTS